METQIIKLDAPYNLILSNTGKIALHIATLILIKEKESNNRITGETSTYTEILSIPVVAEKGKPEGETWIYTDLKDCMVVCRERETVSLKHIQRVLDYCHNHNVIEISKIPRALYIAFKNSGCNITLPTDEDGNIISDYIVNLRFYYDKEGYCIIMNDTDSKFFFCESYYTAPDFDDDGNEIYYDECAIEKMAELRHIYLLMLGAKGLKSIVFTTKDDKFQSFVEKLNSIK